MTTPLLFRSGAETYRADTCEPLKKAAAAGEVEVRAWARGAYPGTPLPARRMPEIRSVGVWDARRPQRWGLDWHTNEGIELTYLSRGKLPFATGDRTWTLDRGAMTITRPWQPHRVGDPHLPANRLTWVIIDVGVRRPNQTWNWPDWLLLSPDDRGRLTTLLSHNERPVFNADRRCAEAFESLARMVGVGSPAAAETSLKLAVNEILVATLKLLEQQELTLDRSLCESQRLVQWFIDELPAHITEPWTLATMAEACGLRRTRFSHYCRQLTNLNPVVLLNRLRIDAAKRMLEEDADRNVTDIALSCGFESSQYFATRFRIEVGCSPREYRERAARR
jgi:AraC family L-rhamnose operon regulatory protein RhaS